MLLAHHGSYTLMDRFVMMEEGLVLFLFLQMVLFFNSQTDKKNIARIIKLSMRHFYLAWMFLQSMGVKHVEAFGDSLRVVQQVSKVCQCYYGSLNVNLDRCLDIISCFDEFVIRHIQEIVIRRQMFWLSKHLAIMLLRNILT